MCLVEGCDDVTSSLSNCFKGRQSSSRTSRRHGNENYGSSKTCDQQKTYFSTQSKRRSIHYANSMCRGNHQYPQQQPLSQHQLQHRYMLQQQHFDVGSHPSNDTRNQSTEGETSISSDKFLPPIK